MQIIFFLFWGSLLGIIIMIGRKMRRALEGAAANLEEDHPLVPELQKIKDLAHRTARRLGYLSLVLLIRLHFKSSKLLREQYSEFKTKVKNRLMKEPGNEPGNSAPSSKFLKIVSEYKHKVRRIKHRIREEER